jgi:hypothetical protein
MSMLMTNRRRTASARPRAAAIGALVAAFNLLLAASACRADALVFQDTFDAENGGVAQFSFAAFSQWNVTRGDVDLIGANGLGEFYPGRGLYVDLDGSPGQGRMETKSSFDLTPGVYRLSLAVGNNPLLGSIVQHNRARVSLAGVFTEDFARNGVTPLEPLVRLIAVTSPTSSRLVLESLDPTDFAGVVVDDVKLERVPEPACVGLTLAAVGAFARSRRRRVRRPRFANFRNNFFSES